MEKALTLNELIENLTRARDMFPELGNKPAVFLDWNDMSWNISVGVYDIYKDANGNDEAVVIG